ncbi:MULTISPECIES: hypothetical protein [unclassified Leucobacter]|uniref:hypothetical protein n=1 Tax=unclassified Leucobacter TaxID=2621730 RepID=UPI000620E676|nr:hypothetical protein [Leucobacter sp. Ag1]KKI17173.1 hypothetical protein XM48_11430 [Leucobacter sp. Ag1]
MTAPARSGPSRGRRRGIAALVAASFFIMLFPPLQWWVGDGGVWYFIVTGLLVLAAIWTMYVLDARAERAESAAARPSSAGEARP